MGKKKFIYYGTIIVALFISVIFYINKPDFLPFSLALAFLVAFFKKQFYDLLKELGM